MHRVSAQFPSRALGGCEPCIGALKSEWSRGKEIVMAEGLLGSSECVESPAAPSYKKEHFNSLCSY